MFFCKYFLISPESRSPKGQGWGIVTCLELIILNSNFRSLLRETLEHNSPCAIENYASMYKHHRQPSLHIPCDLIPIHALITAPRSRRIFCRLSYRCSLLEYARVHGSLFTIPSTKKQSLESHPDSAAPASQSANADSPQPNAPDLPTVMRPR